MRESGPSPVPVPSPYLSLGRSRIEGTRDTRLTDCGKGLRTDPGIRVGVDLRRVRLGGRRGQVGTTGLTKETSSDPRSLGHTRIEGEDRGNERG